MIKICPCPQLLILEIHEKPGAFQIDHRLTILDYFFLILIKNTCKKISQNQLEKKAVVNYLNPDFLNELIEIHIIDTKFLKKFNLL